MGTRAGQPAPALLGLPRTALGKPRRQVIELGLNSIRVKSVTSLPTPLSLRKHTCHAAITRQTPPKATAQGLC